MRGNQDCCLHSWCSSHHHWPDCHHNPRVHLDYRLPKFHHLDRYRTKHLRHRGPKPNHLHCRRCFIKHSHPHRYRIRPDHHRHPITIRRYLHCHPQPDCHRIRGSLPQQQCRAIHHHHHPNSRPNGGRRHHNPSTSSRRDCRWHRRRTQGNQHPRHLPRRRQQALWCRCRRSLRSCRLPSVNGRRLFLLTALAMTFSSFRVGVPSYRPCLSCVRAWGFKKG